MAVRAISELTLPSVDPFNSERMGPKRVWRQAPGMRASLLEILDGQLTGPSPGLVLGSAPIGGAEVMVG